MLASNYAAAIHQARNDQASEPAFLKQLSRKSRFLHIRPYEKWMTERPHRNLLPPA